MKKSLTAVAAIAASTALMVPLFAPSATATPTPRTADTTFGVKQAGTVSVLGNEGHILGGKVVNGTGTVGVEILGQTLQGVLTSASATSTTFNANIKLVALGSTLNMAAAFTGSNWVYSGTTTGDLALEFTGLTVIASEPPATKKRQFPVSCKGMPETLKRNGTTVILNKTCRTNAKQSVRVRMGTHARSARGDVRRGTIATLVYGPNGSVSVRTYGRRGTVVIQEWAPATAAYRAFSHVHSYTV